MVNFYSMNISPIELEFFLLILLYTDSKALNFQGNPLVISCDNNIPKMREIPSDRHEVPATTEFKRALCVTL